MVGVIWGLAGSPPLRQLTSSREQLALKAAELDEESDRLDDQIYFLDKYGNSFGEGSENLGHHLRTIPRLKEMTKKISSKIVNTIYNKKDDNGSDRYL